MTATAGKAAGRRLLGGRASRLQAFMASVMAGAVATAATYKWLRSGGEPN